MMIWVLVYAPSQEMQYDRATSCRQIAVIVRLVANMKGRTSHLVRPHWHELPLVVAEAVHEGCVGMVSDGKRAWWPLVANQRGARRGRAALN